jgi:FtsP/CotA-like multicopper oxidase with cupredoxin domain
MVGAGLFGRRAWAGTSERPRDTAGPVTWTAAPVEKTLRLETNGTADLWAFEGRVPGPALRIKHGDEMWLRLVNKTPQALSLHFQGVRGPNAMDGAGGLTQNPVGPGESFEYRFTPPDPGTFLIRPCVIGGSAEPTERGLAALLLVEEKEPPDVDGDLAYIVDDWLLNDDGSLAPFGSAESRRTGRLGNWLGVNAEAIPKRIEVRPGSRLRLRLANGSNARVMRLRFEEIRPRVIAVDGQPTETFEPLHSSVPFAPGSRYDFLLDMPADPGALGRVVAQVGSGIPLLSLAASGESRPARPPVTPLRPNPGLPAAISLEKAVRGSVAITSDGSDGKLSWQMNGRSGAPGMPPLLRVSKGAPVALIIHNASTTAQPLHLHGHCFRQLHPYDDGWDPWFLDTLLVPEYRSVQIAFVADNPGKWLFASTNLERFDAGLWTWIEVA